MVLHIRDNILATLAYFDVFNYPLTRDEIFLFLRAKCDPADLDSYLDDLVSMRKIYCFDNFYSLKDDSPIATRRSAGNKKAGELLKIAKKISSILIDFPFVRGVAVSGSLSKNFADEKSDIDLFIITSANRLWIARTIMHLFKKLTFLVNKQNFFCMNYYVDEQELEIVEKNIYTATEIVTLIPMEGDIPFTNFFAANSWTAKYLPNNILRISSAKRSYHPWYKRMIELMFDNQMGNALDNRLREITTRRWQKKTDQNKLNVRGVVMSLKADKHYSKPDPSNYQRKLIAFYEDKVSCLLHESTSRAI